jgi:hypothetical protein
VRRCHMRKQPPTECFKVIAALRKEGRWSEPAVTAGDYIVEPHLEASHEGRHNLPRATSVTYLHVTG